MITMSPDKERNLRKAYDTIIKAGFLELPFDKAVRFLDADMMGFGTTIDERVESKSQFRELIESQVAEAANSEVKFEKSGFRFERIIGGGNVAVIVEEINLTVKSGEDSLEFPLRFTCVLDSNANDWKLVHFHSSAAVKSENDTFHINDWKNKNEELRKQVADKTADLEQSLTDLKAAQEQLIVQEKLASLGQLAAGIAHEIKNPMNFVNNFSELSLEYVEEIRGELAKLDQNKTVDEIAELLNDIESNLRKILQHGQRADGIVKSMLQHSRGGNGIMEPTDINAMVREFTNLAFHGMRAGKKPINVKLNYDLDESIGEIPLIADDFSRVILNLCNNAFDAMRGIENPDLTLGTKKTPTGIILSIQDNGTGISDAIKDKILQPFFTTKKGKEGTGLGLAITYDIIKAHGGSLAITTKEHEFTRFEINLPNDQKLKA